jgi:hypothetical protein
MKVLVALSLTLTAAAAAQERVIGLLEIPALHRGVNELDDDRPLGPVTLYAEPLRDSTPNFVVRDRRELESREHDYEQVSAVVSEVRQVDFRVWFRLHFDARGETGYGWINEENAGKYRTAHSLVSAKGLTYLTDAWDGRLFEAPRSDAATTSFSKPTGEFRQVRILDDYDRTEGRDRWYLVVLVSDRCSAEPLEILGFGWVPEFSTARENTVWFYSRGC